MPKRSRSKDSDDVIQHIIAKADPPAPPAPKNPAAVALGRLGGLKGGKARAKALSAKKRAAIAKAAADARWGNRKRP